MTTADFPAAPLVCPPQRVAADWIDYNGHMNMAFYSVVFDRALDHVYDLLGIGADYVRQAGGSCFTREVHIHYLAELQLNAPLHITFQLLDRDAKRLHFFQQMYHADEGFLAATSEQLALHVNMHSRRTAPFPPAPQARLDALFEAHAALPRPGTVGQPMGIRR